MYLNLGGKSKTDQMCRLTVVVGVQDALQTITWKQKKRSRRIA